MSTEEERELLETAIQSPTSFNILHRRFVIIRDLELRTKIRKEYGSDQSPITDACGSYFSRLTSKRGKKAPSRRWGNAAKEVVELLVGWVGLFHEGRECVAILANFRSDSRSGGIVATVGPHSTVFAKFVVIHSFHEMKAANEMGYEEGENAN